MGKKNAGTAIVTYGRSLIALMIAQSLHFKGVRVIGSDSVDLTVLSFSKSVFKNETYADATDNEEQFIDDLCKIIERNQPSQGEPYILIAGFNDAKIISKHKDQFPDYITIACPDYKTIEQVDHKDKLAKTINDYDVVAPKAWLPKDKEDLQSILSGIDFPVFIKPPNDVGGRGISRIENEDELTKAYDKLTKSYPDQQIVIQKAAEGADYCYCGLFDNGERVASMVYHNIRKFPATSGPGVVRETVENKRFDKIVEKLMKPLKWHGVAEIDFLWDEKDDSTPALIEVNPRFWSGLDHSVKSQIDFPWMLYQLFAKGEVTDIQQAEIGYKSRVPGLSSMARLDSALNDMIDTKKLELEWSNIKNHIKAGDLKSMGNALSNMLDTEISLDKAYQSFKRIRTDDKMIEEIDYGKDDPYIAMGVLFILSSLVKHGKLPPEITR